jgi:hypothetical protein
MYLHPGQASRLGNRNRRHACRSSLNDQPVPFLKKRIPLGGVLPKERKQFSHAGPATR